MPNQRKNVLVLYPYADEERDAVSAIVRELAAMLAVSNNVTVLTADKDRSSRGKSRRALDHWLYLGRALCYALTHVRKIDSIIAMDVPTGARLIGVLPRVLSGNRIVNISWVLDMYSTQVARLQQGLLPRNRARVFWDSLGLRASTRIVVLGQCMEGAVRQASSKASTVIPIWKLPTTSKTDLRGRFGLRADQMVVMYSGTAGPNHPMSALVEAVRSIHNEDLVLLVAGRGPEAQRARESVESCGTTNIRFVDMVEDADVPALLATPDLYISILDERVTGTCVPSKTYSAMAAGRACLFLGSSESQAAIDIAAAEAGTTVASSDIQAIANELKTYLSDPGLSVSRGRNALRFIEGQRSPAAAIRKWEEVLG